MKNFKRFLKYVIPHKRNLIISIIFNVLYAFFSAISMLSLFPLMKVLFSDGEKVHIKPVYEGFKSIDKRYLEDSLNYFITNNTKDFKAAHAKLPVVSGKEFMTIILKEQWKF